MFCKHCGNNIPDNAVVCMKCGVATDNFNKEKKKDAPIVAGYLCAFLLPVVGIIVGIYIMVKYEEIAHGIAMVLISLFAWAVWAGIFAGISAA